MQSDTPETDALIAAQAQSLPRDTTDWSEQVIALAFHARKMERERDEARIPICIGRPIIETLAKEGQWISQDGRGVIAASELFGKNPYNQESQCDQFIVTTANETLKHLVAYGGVPDQVKSLATFIQAQLSHMAAGASAT